MSPGRWRSDKDSDLYLRRSRFLSPPDSDIHNSFLSPSVPPRKFLIVPQIGHYNALSDIFLTNHSNI
jgi:hypothetical protein